MGYKKKVIESCMACNESRFHHPVKIRRFEYDDKDFSLLYCLKSGKPILLYERPEGSFPTDIKIPDWCELDDI